ncbi:DUF5683 domain-containing protein [Bacteroidota bacterium]|nr:DUF5683 domain-containing protein [Bacteroidota bacterium]
MNKFIFFVFCFFTTKLSFSQSNEITPKEVAIYSSIIPGSGQFINKKIWKIPIIYTCIGTCIYFASDNNKKYKTYKDEFLNRQNNSISNPELTNISSQDLIVLKDYYRRNRDVSYLFLALSYFINIIDASVDRHLMTFDVNEDLSLSINNNHNNFFFELNFAIN